VAVDGRAARALRTRQAIVDACVQLVEEGDLRPTAPRVAERAGVSVRSVFQHFDDVSSLHLAVAQAVGERVARLVVGTPDRNLPQEERLKAFVAQRALLLEALTPFRRAAQVHGPFSPEIRSAMRAGTAVLRHQVGAVFAPELEAAGDERDGLFEALAAASGWAVWHELRNEAGLPVPAAKAALARTLRALLAT
jgi:AcrR family transcriptional regulator